MRSPQYIGKRGDRRRFELSSDEEGVEADEESPSEDEASDLDESGTHDPFGIPGDVVEESSLKRSSILTLNFSLFVFLRSRKWNPSE
jgi:hypothetical protein